MPESAITAAKKVFSRDRNPHLDACRGVAAFLVCAGHLRDTLFVPYAQAENLGFVNKVLYFLTTLGPQSVIVFFVLSGYLVGGAVFRTMQQDKWEWYPYLLRRLCRLWIVLLPALLVTLVLDVAGRCLNPDLYLQYRHNDIGATTFVGNVLFLQTILVDVFGSNGALWSLSYEFWYYILFPSLAGIVYYKKPLPRILCLLISAALIFFLTRSILELGLIWLMGAGAYFCIQNCRIPAWLGRPSVLLFLFLLLGGSFFFSKYSHNSLWGFFIIGFVFSILVVALSLPGRGSDRYVSIATFASDFSYTLYLTHTPLIVFTSISLLHGIRFAANPLSWGLYLGLLGLILLYSKGIWWLTERNTDSLRRRVDGLFCWVWKSGVRA